MILRGVCRHVKDSEDMSTLNIFVSFEFDKDKDLKNNFFSQANKETQHRIRNFSLNESYPDEVWKNKARAAIRECDVVIILIGPDTHNAQGVIVETDMARSMQKPIIQVRAKGRAYKGITRLGEPIRWKWKSINAKLDASVAQRR